MDSAQDAYVIALLERIAYQTCQYGNRSFEEYINGIRQSLPGEPQAGQKGNAIPAPRTPVKVKK